MDLTRCHKRYSFNRLLLQTKAFSTLVLYQYLNYLVKRIFGGAEGELPRIRVGGRGALAIPRRVLLAVTVPGMHSAMRDNAREESRKLKSEIPNLTR